MASGGDNEMGERGVADQSEEVDAAVLQNQNQKLLQQLESQKNDMHALEKKFEELKEEQNSYDKVLITVNKIWNQLIDDLTLLYVRAGGDPKALHALDRTDCSFASLASVPPEETFLWRLLQTSPYEKNEENRSIRCVQEALHSRHSSTVGIMKRLLEHLSAQQVKNKALVSLLHRKLSSEDALLYIQKLDDSLKEEADKLRRAIDILHQKHKLFSDEINTYDEKHSTEQPELKRLSNELEESLAELEESRRKLVALQMQTHGASVVNAAIANAVNGRNSHDKPSDRARGFRELKNSLEEAKMLSSTRLLELQEAEEENSTLSKQLEDLQSELKDDKYVLSSRPYCLLNDQLDHLKMELQRYKENIESLQADRKHSLRREKELSLKVEMAETAKSSLSSYEARMKHLQLQVQKLFTERNELEIKLEKAEQDIGMTDIKHEIHIMASALTKEMEMMEKMLKRARDAAIETQSLQEEATSLRSHLKEKVGEHKSLSNKCAEQVVEIKSLKALIETLEKEKQELQIFLDMYGRECYDNRTIVEIKESEHRARAQVELLSSTLDDHSLELRVKAAKEAEAACQQRLAAAEAEIVELRAELDTSERDVLELKEAIRIKDAEAEAYISEIETIGQAYEDMQTQNQHLVEQVASRDDYNIKLVSDSVKMKQMHGSLLTEKQTIAKQLQQVNASVDLVKMKLVRNEEHMKSQVAQAAKASSDFRRTAINMDKTKLELCYAEKELKWIKSVVDSSEKDFEQNQKRVHELREEIGRERNERKKLEEELVGLKNEVAELSAESEEAAIQRLQDEIKECKSILKCGVCFDRPKEVVITKCFHLFCNPCIQRNLEIRHRKCPGCGTPFGRNDVREVNI